MNRKNDYIVKSVYRSFVFVSIMTAIVATAGMMIDNVVVGQFLGTECLSAMGLVSPVSLVFSAVGNISSSGGATMAARELGRGNKEKVCSIFSVTMLYTLVTGGILTIGGWIFAPQIAVWLGAKGDVVRPTIDYLRGFFLGAIPTIMMPAVMGFVKMDGSPSLPLLSMGVMSALDVVLDLMMALVFKKGMFGMALATTLSYFAAVAVGFIHFTRSYNSLRFVAPGELWKELGEMVATGAPTAVNRICDTIKTIVFNNMMIVIAGTGAVAALNVRTQVYNLVGSLIMGAGQALMPVTALFYGEEDAGALTGSVKESIRIGMALCAAAMAVLLLNPSFFSDILGVKEDSIRMMADVGIRFFAVSMPVRLMNVLCISFYQSTERNTHAMTASVFQAFAFTVAAAVILVKPFGVDGIFASFLVGEILTFAYLAFYAGRKQGKFCLKIPDYMLLPEKFGQNVLKRWEMSIGNDMGEVMALSSKITERAREENLRPGFANTIALCVEEMAGNVVRHAFKPGEKKWFDVLILEKEHEFIVRMRDNGKMFDPLKYFHENADDKDTEHMGIKLVLKMAKDVQYSRSIGLNNLIVTVEKGDCGPG